MAGLFGKKKRYRFQVKFTLDELTSVSYMSGTMFAKVRLLDGGNFCQNSARQSIINNAVNWDDKFEFVAKIYSDATTGVLLPCLCRVSVRREQRGGRDIEKLGFIDYDLSVYAGQGLTPKPSILQSYKMSRHRPDNSLLKVTINMSLLEGEPIFKVPDSNQAKDTPQHLTDRDTSSNSVTSESSAYSSLPRKDKKLGGESPECEEKFPDITDENGHKRNPSNISHGSGYFSMGHSRQPSGSPSVGQGHKRSPSTGSTQFYTPNSLERPKTRTAYVEHQADQDTQRSIKKRISDTRENADDIVNDLVGNIELNLIAQSQKNENEEGLTDGPFKASGGHGLDINMFVNTKDSKTKKINPSMDDR